MSTIYADLCSYFNKITPHKSIKNQLPCSSAPTSFDMMALSIGNAEIDMQPASTSEKGKCSKNLHTINF